MTNKAAFQNMVRRILNEEIEKRVPEMNANGVNPDKKTAKSKVFPSDPNPRDYKTKDQMEAELIDAAHTVNKTAFVRWDDHDDITINVNDIYHVRITPLWEDNFKIIWHNRNEDRVFITGLTWEQVLEFVKENLNQKNIHTSVEKARDKAWRNTEDQADKASKGLSQDNKPKTLPTTDKPVSKEKNKDKNYTEEQVKEEKDLPNKPMREPGELKTQASHKVQDPVKSKKHRNQNSSHFSKK